jgi:hypothetical protein
MTTAFVHSDDVVVRHVASERGGDKATARQLGGY